MWDFSVFQQTLLGTLNPVNCSGACSLPSTPWFISQQHLNPIANDNTSLICVPSARVVYSKSAKQQLSDHVTRSRLCGQDAQHDCQNERNTQTGPDESTFTAHLGGRAACASVCVGCLLLLAEMTND